MGKNILVYDVQEDLHREFKTFCANKGISMSQAIKQFMRTEAQTITVVPSAQTVIGSGAILNQAEEEQQKEPPSGR